MKIQSFDGGLSTRLRPQFLQANQGTEYLNIDSDIGALGPVMLPEDTGITASRYPYWYDAKQMWIQSDTKRDYLEFQGDLYWTDRVSTPKKFDGTTETKLGIAVPGTPAVKANEAPLSPRGFIMETGFGQGDLPDMDLYYLFIGSNTQMSYGKMNGQGKYTILDRDMVNVPYPASIKDSASDQKHQTLFKDMPYSTKVYRFYKDKWRLVGETTGGLLDNKYDISANAELPDKPVSDFNGVYTYVMTYYNSKSGVESGPSGLSAEADIKNGGSVSLTGLSVSSDPQVDKKRIYRVGGNLGKFTLVTELSNATTSFTDTIKDSDTIGTQLQSPSAAPAPNGLAYLTEAYAMLFAAEGNRLRFTPVGRPNDWPELYFIQYEADITGIAPVANGILVFTKFKTHIVTGTGPTALSSHLLSGDQGCLAFESIQQFGAEALWVSSDGVCASAGGLPKVLTKEALGKVSINAVASAVYDEVYYVLEEDKLWALDRGKIKQFDFGVKTLQVANDELYGYKDGKLVKLFRGNELATFGYKSARFVEGTITDHKTYKKVCIFSSGHVTIKILINDAVVFDGVLDTKKDNHEIQVPQELQRGFYIQFELSGTGEVSEIEYKVGQ